MDAWQQKRAALQVPFFIIVLGSAFFLTVEKIVDSVISNNIVIANDPITAASAYLLVGGWFGVLTSFALGLVLGRYIPSFKGLALPPARPTMQAMLAGATAALATLIVLWGNQLFDLSIIAAISNMFVLFIVFYEWFTGKVTIRSFLLPALLVVIGTALVAYTPAWQEGAVLQDQGLKLLIILIGYNGLVAFGELITKPAVDASDPVNVQIVRFTTLAVTGTVIAFGLAVVRGQLPQLLEASETIIGNPAAYAFLAVLFAAVFIGQVLNLWAKQQNRDVSSIVIMLGLSVGFGFVASLVFDSLSPGFVGAVPADFETRAVRLIGVGTLILSTVLLQFRKRKE